MSQIMIKARNIRTGREYLITEKGWEDILKQGWSNRYEVLDRRRMAAITTDTYIPEEISAAASAAAKALEAGDVSTASTIVAKP